MMDEKIKKLLPGILEMAKKLPKGSKMEVAIPTKEKMTESMDDEEENMDEGEMCPHCGQPMKKKMGKDSLRKLLEE